MILERPRLEWGGIVLPIVTVAVFAALVLGSLPPNSGGITTLDRQELSDDPPEPALPQRLAAMDAALGRMDLSRAAYEWREAYGLALRERRWEGMAGVGDAALRADALARGPLGHPIGFRAEARQAYLPALFQARRERSQEGVTRVADAFDALGDADTAARARAIVVAR
jgi:hypothetical protein